ncbi:unnamed protein product, partial [Mesorhabditis spiculigera]
MRLVALLVFAATLQVTFAIECFHCHDCDNEAAEVKTCHNEHSQCYSLLGPVTRRGCGTRCPYNSQFEEEECHLCSDDLCNHHQQGAFLRKAIHHHRGHRLRRDKDQLVHSHTSHYQDGSQVKHFESAADELPPLGGGVEQTEEVVKMAPSDPRYGKVDEDGVAYLPIDEKGDILPEYRHLLDKYTGGSIAQKTVIDAGDDKIVEVKTSGDVYPPGVAAEDIIREDEDKIIGAGIGGGAAPKVELPEIPAEMSEEEMTKMADQIEKILEDERVKANTDKMIADETKAIGEGAFPSPTAKPDSASSSAYVLSFIALILIYIS